MFDVKRLIGRQYSDSSVQKDKKLFPFGVVADGKGKPLIEVKSGPKRVVKKISPEEVSGMVSIFLFSFSIFHFPFSPFSPFLSLPQRTRHVAWNSSQFSICHRRRHRSTNPH